MAGVPGLEPGPKVLETSMLTIDTIPLKKFSILDYRFAILLESLTQSQISIRKSKIQLFVFSMRCMTAATTTKLFEFQAVRRGLFIFCRNVIALLTLGAL
jgi:hypothetical protein